MIVDPSMYSIIKSMFNVWSIIHEVLVCHFPYLSRGTRRGCEGDLVMVDGTLDQAPHQSDGVVCRSRHSEIHGHVQTW